MAAKEAGDKWFVPLGAVGFPSPSERRDLWTHPRAPIGLDAEHSSDTWLIYYEGRVLAAVTDGVPEEATLAYLTGPAFDPPPPAAIQLSGHHSPRALIWGADCYSSAPNLPTWQELVQLPAGQVSRAQAEDVLRQIAEENRTWYADERSQRVLGVLPRIFPEGTVILYELLQNAADSGATRASFALERNLLVFAHDGAPFTENDVYAISFVNCSFKPIETIGFMGIGFKAAHEVCAASEVHSPPYHFRFDYSQNGGELLPEPLAHRADVDMPDGCTTVFRLLLREDTAQLVERELEKLDSKLLLYIGNRLRLIETPKGSYSLRRVSECAEVRRVAIDCAEGGVQKDYLVISHRFTPTDGALNDFAHGRNADPGSIVQRATEVSIAARLRSEKSVARATGHLQVFLPTSIKLPFNFDVQGNFVVDASRRQLRNPKGPWNAEHFAQLGQLLIKLLEYAKKLALADDALWTSLYGLLPDWSTSRSELEFLDHHPRGEEGSLDPEDVFERLLQGRDVVPAMDRDGCLVFVRPADAVYVDPDVEKVLPAQDIARLAGSCTLWPKLGSGAKRALSPYLRHFGRSALCECLKRPDWENGISAFGQGMETRSALQQLARILAYVSGDYAKWRYRIILTKDCRLREEIGAGRKVYSLPETMFDLPVEDIGMHLDLVSPALLQMLRHPEGTDLDLAEAARAWSVLRDVAPEMTAKDVAKQVVRPAFSGDDWRHLPDERLMRYTLFLLQSGLHESSYGLKVKVRSKERRYLPPDEVYLGREYSAEGERLERLCHGVAEIEWVSDCYLRASPQVDRRDWERFFLKTGVACRPRVRRVTTYIFEYDLEKLRRETGNSSLQRRDLRVSPLNGSIRGVAIPGKSYAIDDFQLDKDIMSRVRALCCDKPRGWKRALQAFAEIIEEGWGPRWTGGNQPEDEYSSYVHRHLRYVPLRESEPRDEKQPRLSTFGRFLQEEAWLPADTGDEVFVPSQLTLPTPDNKADATDETALAVYEFENEELIDFLGIQRLAPSSTPIGRLRSLARRGIRDLDRFRQAYQDLSEACHDDGELRALFGDERLVFVPDHPEVYLPLDRVIFARASSLSPHFAAVRGIYEDMEAFFVGRLRLPAEETVEHCARYLREHAWQRRTSGADQTRSAVVHCYRRLLDHLWEAREGHEQDARAELRALLGEEPMVYCGSRGWVATRPVAYPDAPEYANEVERFAGIPVESHIRRLERPVSQLRPLLEILGLDVLSEMIEERPALETWADCLEAQTTARALRLLLRTAARIIQLGASGSDAADPRTTAFLTNWDSLAAKLDQLHFVRCSPIRLEVCLRPTSQPLATRAALAYVREETDGIVVHLAGEMLVAYSDLSEQLQRLLRTDQLPAELRSQIDSLILGNAAGLDRDGFDGRLKTYLSNKRWFQQGDEWFRDLLTETLPAQAPLGGIEGSSQVAGLQDGETTVREDQEGDATLEDSTAQRSRRDDILARSTVEDAAVSRPTEARSSSQVRRDDGTPASASRPDQGDAHRDGESVGAPRPPTADEILAGLPEIDDDSYKDVHVVAPEGLRLVETVIGELPGTAPVEAPRVHSESDRGRRGATEVAHGRRGEEWVLECERRLLRQAGRQDLAGRVVHRSQSEPSSLWDIESFEKTAPFEQIFIEVKATSGADNFSFEMSDRQFMHALSHPTYLYCVVDVASSRPRAYVYRFAEVIRSGKVDLRAATIRVTLPQPESGGIEGEADSSGE